MVQYVLTRFRCFTEKKVGKKGQGMVEYALILAFVVVLAAALTNAGGLRTAIEGAFTNTSNAITDVQP